MHKKPKRQKCTKKPKDKNAQKTQKTKMHKKPKKQKCTKTQKTKMHKKPSQKCYWKIGCKDRRVNRRAPFPSQRIRLQRNCPIEIPQWPVCDYLNDVIYRDIYIY